MCKVPAEFIDGDLELGAISYDPEDERLISEAIYTDRLHSSFRRRSGLRSGRTFQPKSGSSNPADRAKPLKELRISTASQFIIRGITDSVATACGLKTYPILGGSKCRI